MKALRPLFILSTIAVLCIGNLQAQIGIGTTEPNGILDLNSTDYGLVFPTVALTSTTSQSPVVNPAGGSLAVGTTVYNTAITSTGSNDVHTGLYSWTGSIWAPQFIKKEIIRFEQTGGSLRVEINPGSNPDPDNQTDIPGLDFQTFTPTYSGTYRIEVKSNFGGGEVTNFANAYDGISLCTTEGSFFFYLDGPGVLIDPVPAGSIYDYSQGWSYTHSYSALNEMESPAIESTNMTHHGTLLYYHYLRAGETYTFNLGVNLYTGDAYVTGSGSAGTDGRGYAGHYTPCSVEFEYIGD